MNKGDLKFSEGDVIVSKATWEKFRVVGIEDVWIYGRKIIHRFNYILLDRYDRILSYHWDFVEKVFDYYNKLI